jgi:hypothetical protein
MGIHEREASSTGEAMIEQKEAPLITEAFITYHVNTAKLAERLSPGLSGPQLSAEQVASAITSSQDQFAKVELDGDHLVIVCESGEDVTPCTPEDVIWTLDEIVADWLASLPASDLPEIIDEPAEQTPEERDAQWQLEQEEAEEEAEEPA